MPIIETKQDKIGGPGIVEVFDTSNPRSKPRGMQWEPMPADNAPFDYRQYDPKRHCRSAVE